jgi:hypothetical protein
MLLKCKKDILALINLLMTNALYEKTLMPPITSFIFLVGEAKMLLHCSRE